MRPAHHLSTAAQRQQDLLGSLGLWLGLGSLALLSGLLPMHSILLGWSAPFWMLLAPLLLTLIIAPGLPGQWLRRQRNTRRARHTVGERIWN